jgi:hypothetical protein
MARSPPGSSGRKPRVVRVMRVIRLCRRFRLGEPAGDPAESALAMGVAVSYISAGTRPTVAVNYISAGTRPTVIAPAENRLPPTSRRWRPQLTATKKGNVCDGPLSARFIRAEAASRERHAGNTSISPVPLGRASRRPRGESLSAGGSCRLHPRRHEADGGCQLDLRRLLEPARSVR